MSAPAETDSGVLASSPAGSSRDVLVSLLLAVVASLVTFLVYTPRLQQWRGVGDRIVHRSPEYGRANALMDQVADPWQTTIDPLHRVLNWRKLFSVLWHYAHLPPRWLLAVPHLGCIGVLWLVAYLTRQRLRQWNAAAIATFGFAPLPWFFVSSGWLGYFDSWLVLGLVAAAFVRSRGMLATSCLLTPWVDERFVLALPVTLLVRAAALDPTEHDAWAAWRRDVQVAALASIPYLAVRLIALLAGESDAPIYVQAHLLTIRQVPLTRFVAGLWSGYRAEWLVIAAGVALSARRIGRTWAIALALAVLAITTGGLCIALDMSRTTMMICPVLLLGLWLWQLEASPLPRWLLAAIVLANFVLPATHELWFAHFRIEHFPIELARLRGPLPPAMQAAQLIAQAEALAAENKPAEARAKLDAAIALDDRYGLAFAQRAAVRIIDRDVNGALEDADRALSIQADMPYALFLRGLCRAMRGERAAAIEDVQHSLDVAGPNWFKRPQAEQLIKQLTAQPAPPAPAQP